MSDEGHMKQQRVSTTIVQFGPSQGLLLASTPSSAVGETSTSSSTIQRKRDPVESPPQCRIRIPSRDGFVFCGLWVWVMGDGLGFFGEGAESRLTDGTISLKAPCMYVRSYQSAGDGGTW